MDEDDFERYLRNPPNGGIVLLYQLANLAGWLLLAALAALAALAGRAVWKQVVQ